MLETLVSGLAIIAAGLSLLVVCIIVAIILACVLFLAACPVIAVFGGLPTLAGLGGMIWRSQSMTHDVARTKAETARLKAANELAKTRLRMYGPQGGAPDAN